MLDSRDKYPTLPPFWLHFSKPLAVLRISGHVSTFFFSIENTIFFNSLEKNYCLLNQDTADPEVLGLNPRLNHITFVQIDYEIISMVRTFRKCFPI